MALTFKKRDDFDKVLGDLGVLPPEITFDEKNEKPNGQKVKSAEDFLINNENNTKAEKSKNVQ
ncbi:hypothetical protein Hs30E_09280 [Lactococcus hodotermopsidis]|uniref:Uncharacterized protein n=1 Tax=Pseudolactococcus hodotermopsidis TaxID=2709157 RepID=A0A6A0BEW1_9LACT|nr:SPJ_0845 family protein [Lactococcus hodotermopsidis]GFH42377.1 hypothetical protein Hs30E_09280 [Lactococcus hodotermopsidis]